MQNNTRFPLYGGCAVITTFRCNSHCKMCHRHEHQSKANEEFSPDLILKLPHMWAMNITGGEPFLRDDIEKIVENAYKRAQIVSISTNGTQEEKILKLMKKFPKTRLRISIEGIANTNDSIRGIRGGYIKIINLILNLKILDYKHVGLSITVGDNNYEDLLPLYDFCRKHEIEFATGTVHNSFFFESTDNAINHKKEVSNALNELADRMQKEGTFKEKYRAIFNRELVKYVNGEPIRFPCYAANGFFALSPYGDVLACVGSELPREIGNITYNSFEDVWDSEKANNIRQVCSICNRNCCMSGHVGVAMRKEVIQLLPEALLGRKDNGR